MNISRSKEDTKNWTSIWSITIPPVLGEKVWWTLVQLPRRSEGQIIPPQIDFSRTIFWPVGGAAPPNFYMLENDQVLLAHPTPGMRVPIAIFYSGVKNWLKIQCIIIYHFGVRGVTPRNFEPWRAIRLAISFMYNFWVHELITLLLRVIVLFVAFLLFVYT